MLLLLFSSQSIDSWTLPPSAAKARLRKWRKNFTISPSMQMLTAMSSMCGIWCRYCTCIIGMKVMFSLIFQIFMQMTDYYFLHLVRYWGIYCFLCDEVCRNCFIGWETCKLTEQCKYSMQYWLWCKLAKTE